MPRPAKKCSVEGCENKNHAYGYCRMHHERAVKDGTLPGTICNADGCESVARSSGYCMTHYYRWKRHGDPSKLVNTGRRIENGYVALAGYRDHPNSRADGSIREHVLVMSQMLGRPLKDGEYVHHKNGDRQDNRPENLELVVESSHHAGQKATDLVEHYASALSDEELLKAIGHDRVRRLANTPRKTTTVPKQRTINKLDVGWFSA